MRMTLDLQRFLKSVLLFVVLLIVMLLASCDPMI